MPCKAPRLFRKYFSLFGVPGRWGYPVKCTATLFRQLIGLGR